jgi:hypothetical protein
MDVCIFADKSICSAIFSYTNLSPQDRFEVSPELIQGKMQYNINNEIKLIGKDKDKFKCVFTESSGNGSTLKNDYRNEIWIADVKAVF